MILDLPDVYSVDEQFGNNCIRQIAERGTSEDGTLPTFKAKGIKGFRFQPSGKGQATEPVLIVERKVIPEGYDRVLQASVHPEGGKALLRKSRWLKHPLLHSTILRSSRPEAIQAILDSWDGAFLYREEHPSRGIVGLRRPQIGALHAIHAHWTIENSPATIVMPTGTGKTEVMLSVLISAKCSRLLVIVPTDALRSQLSEKFLSLGILKERGSTLLSKDAYFPIVCTLSHIPKSKKDVDEIFRRAQVIVTTSNIAGSCGKKVQEQIARHCPYLFIDEAHHAEAPTWKAFKDSFVGRRILQFTATPFREDGKPVDGKIIYNYPLRTAQEDGYFKPIQFKSVVEFDLKRADESVAEKAVGQLRKDASKGHILMARVDSVARAREVFALYERYPEFNPVQLHTGVKSRKQREGIRRDIISGHSRIVVCVDMLGEGFDLPELKIAAFHDIRKTLAVTLQLVGRFARARKDLGDPVFVANTADVSVQEELRKLYTRDPDWNVLLPQISETVIDEQISLQEFLSGFSNFVDEVPLRTVRPATSAVVYKTRCKVWTPENYRSGLRGISQCEQVHDAINSSENTLVVITARRAPVDWSNVEQIYDWMWELLVLFWYREHDLLFINSSSNSGHYLELAKAVAGDDVELIRGQQVFRSFAGIHRLRLQNVGLTEQLGRNVRYTGRMGSDVAPALSETQRRRALRSVLSGGGYEFGRKSTVGASRRGRIWSHRREAVNQLVAWCKRVGEKLLDESIDPDDVLRGTLEAVTITSVPSKMPIFVDWPEEMYKNPEAASCIVIGGEEFGLGELDLNLRSPQVGGPLIVVVRSETVQVELELQLFESDEGPDYRFEILESGNGLVRRGGHLTGLPELFYYFPPIIWFNDGSSLEGNQYVELKHDYPPYDAGKIEVWDWRGVDLKKESQGPEKNKSSIQYRVIQNLRDGDYEVLFDDDGPGEAADVVAIRLVGEPERPKRLEVELYHCKFSGESTPGSRVGDLYEVCGQAQKSIHWCLSPEKGTDLFTHLLRRESLRTGKGLKSRFELGDTDTLLRLREMSRVAPLSLRIYIVQPGLSCKRAKREPLELLSVTENYLLETYQIDMAVIASQ